MEGEVTGRSDRMEGEVTERGDRMEGEVTERGDRMEGEVTGRDDQMEGEVTGRGDRMEGEVTERQTGYGVPTYQSISKASRHADRQASVAPRAATHVGRGRPEAARCPTGSFALASNVGYTIGRRHTLFHYT